MPGTRDVACKSKTQVPCVKAIQTSSIVKFSAASPRVSTSHLVAECLPAHSISNMGIAGELSVRCFTAERAMFLGPVPSDTSGGLTNEREREGEGKNQPTRQRWPCQRCHWLNAKDAKPQSTRRNKKKEGRDKGGVDDSLDTGSTTPFVLQWASRRLV
jgi:hypothetical protein